MFILGSGMSEITRLLEAAERGEREAEEKLLNLVYAELHRMAEQKLAGEAPGHTLQPTALVHDAWFQLVGGDTPPSFANRAHFFGAAAEAMRRILIDRARRKRAMRHGGGQKRVDVDDVEIASATPDDQLLSVNEALDKLAAQDKQKAELVKLRYFIGMTIEEAAQILGVSEPTAKRYWAYARAWLYHEIQKG